MKISVIICIVVFAAVSSFAAANSAILPLAEVRPGMEGEFRTVINGTEIEAFPVRIVGVVDNFIGPKRPIIWAEALDEDNRLFGPVSGMSGSPVFINGKLIGAYAYGYNFPKDQALIGIQPIESMLEIPELRSPEDPVMGSPFNNPVEKNRRLGFLSEDGFPGNEAKDWDWIRGGWEDSRRGMDRKDGQFHRLPMPLMLGGFSSRTLSVFRPHLERLGIDVMQSALGGSRTENEISPADLRPGAPLAGVLMSGDFNAAGVGTVTFRDGDRILAFGHPFFQYGPTEIPMGTAEIVTIVQSVASSFKLSKLGPVIGTIVQDRLTGIEGVIGREASTIDLNVSVEAGEDRERTYSGKLFQHRQLSPILAAMAMMESLFSTVESENEQTIYSSVRINIEGHDPLHLNDVGSGQSGPTRIIMDFLSVLMELMDNPFSFPEINSIDLQFKLSDSWDQQILQQVIVENGEAVAGEPLDLRVIMHDYLGEPVHKLVSIPVPKGTEGEVLEVEIMDASRVNPSWWSSAGNQSPYRSRPDARSLEAIIGDIRDRKGFQAVYVRVYREAEGVRMRGMDLEGLPPSYLASIASPKTAEVMQRSDRAQIWEGDFPTSGEFRGYYRFQVEVKQ